MGLNVGLDFGTSNSGVAIFDGHQVQLLAIDQCSSIPEVVKTILYITRDHQVYIGQEAIELYYRDNVNRHRRYVRKWIGEIDFVGSELQYVRDVYMLVDELLPGRLLQYLKTALRRGDARDGYSGTQIFDRYYTIEDLVQLYLSHLKMRAEAELGEKISTVTLGRPVKFSESVDKDRLSQDTLKRAALKAGFEEVDFEFEPIAAALFYETSLKNPENVVIFDFGGGTLDIAIMRLKDRFVYGSGGIDIAGSDFDRCIIETRLLQHFGLEESSHEPVILELIEAVPDWAALPELSTPLIRQTLEERIKAGLAPARLKTLQSLIFNDLAFSFYNKVEAAKISLSSQGAAIIALRDRGIDLWELYTRSQFEKDIGSFQAKIQKVFLDTISRSGLKPKQIDAVVKTGGSSNIPVFSAMLSDIFGSNKIKATHMFSSVASGLAIRAWENKR